MEPKNDISKTLDDVLPITEFGRGITWTKHGTAKGLSEEVMKHAQDCLKKTSEVGIIYFERLPDGGYEIGHFASYK